MGTLDVLVVVAASTWAAVVLVFAAAPRVGRWACTAVIFAAAAAAGIILAELGSAQLAPVVVASLVTAVVAWGYGSARPELSAAGATLWVVCLVFGATTMWWTVRFMSGLSVSPVSKGLLWSALFLSALTVPSAVVTTREGWDPLLRNLPRAQRVRGSIPSSGASPRVSIHVPCHAEPPELVMGTLDRLADLEYDNYEVLVIDNNTMDPQLWLPVRDYCRQLGPRFRFLHVEGITGAKAGALNWAMPYTDPQAVLIAVVDADYHVQPEWLRETVGYFADPGMGFVQCPHAYRDYEGSRFATWANWEYAVFFQTGMVSLDAHGAGLTVGTMSLIRKRALVEAGGWAEWCLTEDSELAIRIHAAGYESVYLTEPYGRGLVPETFEAYRRQRFRWTFGPVQEFRRHWRLFLPARLGGRPSGLTRTQRLHHANHGVDVIGIGIRVIAFAVGVGAALSMALHHENVPMPFALWIASASALFSSCTMRLLVYRRAVGATIAQSLGGIIAFAALSMVIAIASLRATIGLSSAWHRTNKFTARSNVRRAIAAASTEASTGPTCFAGAAALFTLSPHGGIVTMLSISLAATAATLLTAPTLAILADRDLTTVPTPDPQILTNPRRVSTHP